MGADRILRRHMDGAHEPARLISADGKQGQARRTEALADGGEVRAERGVASEIDNSIGGLQDVSAPQSFVAIEKAATGKVECGYGVDEHFADGNGLAPIEFVHWADGVRAKKTADAEWYDKATLAANGEAAESCEIEVIEVIVAEEDDINRRQFLPPDAGRATAARADPLKRAGAFGPDRVGEDVGAALLKQDGGVVDERDSEFVTFDAEGRLRWDNVRNEAGRGFTAAV